MPWYVILALVSIVVAPFDALYMYIKASRRRERIKEEESEDAKGKRETGISRRPEQANGKGRDDHAHL